MNKRHLPYPLGPYATGSVELMTEYSPEGCFFRIFYPIDISPEKLDKYSDKWVPWMPHEMYLKGFANANKTPFFIYKHGQTLIRQKPYFIPTISNAPLSQAQKSYPLFIFSHGYAATKFLCSEYCNSIASYGFVVAAVEHRDKSAAATYYYDSPESVLNKSETWIKYESLYKTYDVHRHIIRNSQVKIRCKEICKVLDILSEMNNGDHVTNILNSPFDLTQFKGKLSIENIVMSGFSFGGMTSIYAAANDNRIKAAIIVDGWMSPLKCVPLMSIKQPILFLNSQTFHLPSNVAMLRKYFYSEGIRELYTIKNTSHENHTDSPYIWGYWLGPFMWNKMNSTKVLRIQSSLTVKFLHDHTGYPESCENAEAYIKENRDRHFVDYIICCAKKYRTKSDFDELDEV
ncbi:platelet-activating factor acetylhydrolase-like [Adelges cooleyi]|uniref:platelet-activating factor acetylhydrolase-like n=1 Tax=Adelges cooleyi TaxID=133065 RepID=UPI00217FFD62|nr:platelet-activating factor acetylhydrolase-like [Adelges cooleyi]